MREKTASGAGAAPSVSWPEQLQIFASALFPRLHEQQTGVRYYSETLLPTQHWSQPSVGNLPLSYSGWRQLLGLQPEPRPDPAPAPAATAAPPQLSLAQLEADAERQRALLAAPLEFLEEENQLILEARALGKSWGDIARMIPGRSVALLRRHFNTVLRPKPPAPKRPRPDPSPPERPASTSLTDTDRPTTDSGAEQDASGGGPPKRRSSLAPAAAEPAQTSTDAYEIVEVDGHCTARSGGDERVQLSKPLPAPPPGFTGQRAHKLASLEGVKFYEAAAVVDPDDPAKVYRFDLNDACHGACFNIGIGPDGTPLISWSDLHALYQLPDGTKWAEHGYLNDAEDLEELGKKLGKDHVHLIPHGTTEQELYKKRGRYHSRLQNVEYECWLFRDVLPREEAYAALGVHPGDAYYWRTIFDPRTLGKVA